MMVRCLSLGAALTAGCLMPPPIDEGPANDNNPPRILPEIISPPPTAAPRVININCARYQFFASITDPDPFDTLYWRVFVNYYRSVDQDNATLLETTVYPAPPDEARPGSPRALSFSIDSLDPRFGDTAQRFNQAHTIELFVSDRPIFAHDRVPVARAVPDDGLTDTFVWPIMLSDDPNVYCTEGSL